MYDQIDAFLLWGAWYSLVAYLTYRFCYSLCKHSGVDEHSWEDKFNACKAFAILWPVFWLAFIVALLFKIIGAIINVFNG